MASLNGLNTCRDVCRTAERDSNEYIRVGEAVQLSVESPLIVESENGLNALTIAESNAGNAIIVNGGTGTLGVTANGNVTVQSTANNISLQALSGIAYVNGQTVSLNSNAIQINASAGETHTVTGTLLVNVVGTEAHNPSQAFSVNSNAIVLVSDDANPNNNTTGVTIQANTASGNAGLLLQNANATPKAYTITVPGATAGGLIQGNLQIFSYNNGSYQNEILNVDNAGGVMTLISKLDIQGAGATTAIRPSGALGPANSIQTQASKYWDAITDISDVITLDYSRFNSIMYVNAVSGTIAFNKFQMRPLADSMPLGTTVAICRDPASTVGRTIELLYDTTVLYSSPDNTTANVVYTFTKVKTTNTSADWVILGVGL
jgi:hypothetical protein